MPDIGSSVGIKDGIPCYNNPTDQTVVLDLLEKIDVAHGGVAGDPKWTRPPVAMLRWKFCAEPLRSAILKFQTANRTKLPYLPDGHVDPGGATIRLLNSLAAAGGTIETIGGVDITGGLQEIELEIHDLRIEGSGRFAPNRHVRYVNSKTSIAAVLSLIDVEIRKARQITRLDLVAHGYHTGDALFGVMLGREGIHPGFTALQDMKDGADVVYPKGTYAENLSLWSRFKSRIDEIRFYACGAANSSNTHGTGYADMDMSGYEMCGRLAVHSGAYVMAAKNTQLFNYSWDVDDGWWRSRTVDSSYEGLPADPKVGRPDRANTRVAPTRFGDWEGPVYVFSPISGRVIATSTNGADPVYARGA